MGGGSGLTELVVLAVDDEQPALDELVHLLENDQRVGSVVPALGAADAIQALRTFNDDDRGGLDAVFLDIRMPGRSGMEIAQALGQMRRAPAVVFVTADDSQAVAAFDIGAVDYLLKPLRADRLSASLVRVIEAVAAARARHVEESADDVIPVELAGVTTLVRRSAVQWAQASGDYVRLHTAAGSHLVRMPLRTLARRWEPAGFAQIHRSYLVSLALVEELTCDGSGRQVRIRAGQESRVLPVSRRAFSELKRRLSGL
jgi:two-component system response regulator LytT